MVYFYIISSNNIPYCEITVYHNISEVNRCIKKLKTGKSAEPDLISNEIIKFSGICTCKSITKLFNLTLDSGKYPSNCRKSCIIHTRIFVSIKCIGA
jgi:hypothetical protein